MRHDGLQSGPLGGVYGQALADEVSARCGRVGLVVELGSFDLVVLLEGNIPVDEVKEQDAQGPDSGLTAIVQPIADPLWWAVHSGAWRREKSGFD